VTCPPAPASPSLAEAYAHLALNRHSVRAYTARPVAPELLAELLELARRAPSGANLQPGQVYALGPLARARLGTELQAAYRSGAREQEDYSYFPQPMPQRLRRRQVAAAQALYGALGVTREDRVGRDAQFARNFDFFGAPVALLLTLDRNMGSGCYMDLGMMLYGLMLAAQAHGLASCAIGALASYPALIRRCVQLPPEQLVVCGLALGYADPDAPVNQTRTAREPLAQYFHRMD
jgi:nitroreductase